MAILCSKPFNGFFPISLRMKAKAHITWSPLPSSPVFLATHCTPVSLPVHIHLKLVFLLFLNTTSSAVHRAPPSPPSGLFSKVRIPWSPYVKLLNLLYFPYSLPLLHFSSQPLVPCDPVYIVGPPYPRMWNRGYRGLAKGLEHLQILLSVGVPGANPLWIPRDDCIYLFICLVSISCHSVISFIMARTGFTSHCIPST